MARPKGSSDGSPTQWEMVKATLDELGDKTKPQAIQDHIKTKFDKLLSKSLISNYKSNMKSKGATKGKKRGRPVGSVNAATAVAKGAKGISFDDLAAVRGLVGRLGADQVRQLVEVLA